MRELFAVVVVVVAGCGDPPAASSDAGMPDVPAPDASPSCPAIGTAVGSACTTSGAGMCNGDSAVTCEMIAGCLEWVDHACADASLTCAESGATAACVCPENPGPTWMVDPNAAAIAVGTMTVARTGVTTPFGCAYATLGPAIAGATAYLAGGGTSATVSVTSASPAVFTTETWPLVIPAHVIVSAFDTALPPTRFTLQPPDGIGAAIIEGGGQLNNFAIEVALPATGTAAVTFAGCTAAHPSAIASALGITFAPGAGGYGIWIVDPGAGEQACAATIGSTTITGAFDGVRVSSATGAAPTTAAATITASHIENSVDVGVHVFQSSPNAVVLHASSIDHSGSVGAFADPSTDPSHSAALTIDSTSTITNDIAGAHGVVGRATASQGQNAAQVRVLDTTIDGAGVGGDNIVLETTRSTFSNVQAHGSAGNAFSVSGGGTVVVAGCALDDNGGAGMSAAGNGASLTFTISNGSFDGNGTYGIDIADRVGVTVFGFATFDDNVQSGLRITGQFASFSHVNNSGSGSEFDGNGLHGIEQSGGTVHVVGLDAGLASFISVSDNGGSGIAVSGNANFYGSVMNVADNAGGGMTIAPVTGSFALSKAQITNHDHSAVIIDNANASTGAVQIVQTTITSAATPIAGSAGIEIRRSAVPATGSSTVIDTTTITGAARGIVLGTGANDPLAVDLEGVIVESCAGAGILYDSTSAANTLVLVDDHIVGNGATVWGNGASVGGIGFAGVPPAALEFAGNTIGNNAANQVFVYLDQSTTAASYVLDGSQAPNAIVQCSADPTTFGLYAAIAPTATGSSLAIGASDDLWTDTDFTTGNKVGVVGSPLPTVDETNPSVAACPGL